MADPDWEDVDPDALMRAAKQHDWMTESRFKRMFEEIEDKLQGVLGTGQYDWVDRRVFDAVFDRSTLMSLHKLMQSGEIETVDYPIARGKEAHVFHATTNQGPAAVKIFHTTNAVFKSLAKYIDGDPRFGGLKRRHRELVKIWVRKEYRNLRRMRKAGIRVPRPRAVLNNVLVMDLIGDESEPSPRLKDITIDDPKGVFDDLLEMLAVCWQTCDLAHADFSEYNILWYDGEPWVIDVGQAVVSAHPSSNEFLVRDVTRIVQWINRQGYEVNLADSLLRVLEEPVPTYPSLSGGD
ncbi:MAG: serine protein kinase RIO [Candidatus Thalassarchaeum sp.]|mgnify:FL=1|nr:serine protein kinase RIO [Candidatus Thalassarchaeum sp.]MED5257792.1 serine protein kinase RIO [Candidatus Thermoplasmatota archaeon]MED5455736.1 serine protein kinase RIO [Candidatus Thermoplasmatota archaeon]